MAYFVGRLTLTPVGMSRGDRWYEIVEPFGYKSTLLGILIKVPAGFLTDLASVPRVAQNAIQKDEGNLEAAVIHDYLYSRLCQIPATREDADRCFLEAMTVAGVGPVKRGLMFHAVRWFGWRSWKKR